MCIALNKTSLVLFQPLNLVFVNVTPVHTGCHRMGFLRNIQLSIQLVYYWAFLKLSLVERNKRKAKGETKLWWSSKDSISWPPRARMSLKSYLSELGWDDPTQLQSIIKYKLTGKLLYFGRKGSFQLRPSIKSLIVEGRLSAALLAASTIYRWFRKYFRKRTVSSCTPILSPVLLPSANIFFFFFFCDFCLGIF